MNCTISGFKSFSLSTGNLDDIGYYCENLAEKLDINENELGDYLMDDLGTFYCSDPDLADRFGLLSNDDFYGDIKSLSDELGIDTATATDIALDASETISGSGRYNTCDWFTGACILFTNLSVAVNKHMAWQFEISLHNAGINQTQFCKLVGVTRQAVHKWKVSGTYPKWVEFSLIGISLASPNK